jgi:hypothetical protein
LVNEDLEKWKQTCVNLNKDVEKLSWNGDCHEIIYLQSKNEERLQYIDLLEK